ncbi:VWA domain-containing protein [Sessilibacter corallicola]|uniref:VWA domain-containing protein n=1 Tax=Sessilibacter corallicola TaxID=2904075 RepID=A0ABQ0AAK1_9GAMM
MNEFHFLRPEYLLALIPLAVITYLLLRHLGSQNSWQGLINPELLKHLIDQPNQSARRWPIVAIGALWSLLVIAAAGPTWEKLPQPTLKKEHSLLILWDLSPSMRAEDVKPSRLDRSRFKLIDLLNKRKEGQTGLIVYAGEAYVVTPLSDDTETIISQLDALVPELMPVPGSNTEMAIEQALEVFNDSGIASGDILLVTDGVVPLAAQTVKNFLTGTNHRLSVLAIGSEQGAPVPRGNEFARSASGDIIIDRTDFDLLANLARDNNGRYAQLSLNNRDVDYLTQMFDNQTGDTPFDAESQNDRQFDSWSEAGPWLVLMLLPFVALAFRRGWLIPMVLVTTTSVFTANDASALEWQDLWKTKDQQAYELFEDGKNAEAADVFEDSQWKATAQYKDGNFEAASELFTGETASAYYNRGNALAKSGKLDEAIAAYDQALNLNPELKVAEENKSIVEQLKEQQQQQQNQQQQNSDEQSDQDQQQDQSQQQNSQSDQQNGDQSQDSQDFADNDQSQQEQDAQQQDQDSKGEQKDGEESSQEQSEQEVAEDSQNSEQEGETQEQQQTAQLQESDLTDEEQQALEQWLKQVPDDPAGLLRRKFQHEYRQRRQEYRSGQWSLPSNNAASRL